MEQLILEGISRDVISLAEKIGQEIVDKSQQSEKQFSDKTLTTYTEGMFVMNISDVFKTIDKLSITYIMYFTSDNSQLRYCVYDEQKNTSADYNTKTMTIVSGYVVNKIERGFIGKIAHELNHLYEYDCGLKKRVNLYDQSINLAYNGNYNAQMVGRMTYYCFKHEQDAFAHQFYSELESCLSYQKLTELLEHFFPYQDALKTYKHIIENQDNNTIKIAINSLGFKRRIFFKFIKNGLQRFKLKLQQAYNAYAANNYLKLSQNNEGAMNRLLGRRQIYLTECEKYGNLPINSESIYNF